MDPALAKAINELAIALVSGIATIVLPLLWLMAKNYANAKIAHINNNEVRSALEFAMTRLDATSQTVVTELNQTRAEMEADGKLTQDEAKKLLATAYARVKARIPSDAIATLQNAFGERLQAVVVGKIESKVAAAKVTP